MAKIKKGQETLLTREQYNLLKKMDRTEAENFIKSYYDKGYSVGNRDAQQKHLEDSDLKKSIIRGDLTADILVRISSIPGIGSAMVLKIINSLKKMG